MFAQGKHSSSFRCRVIRVVLHCTAFVLVVSNKFMATLEVSLTTVHAPGQTASKQSKSQLTEPNLMRHPVLLMSTKVVKDHRRSEDSSVMIKCQSTYPTVRWTTWRWRRWNRGWRRRWRSCGRTRGCRLVLSQSLKTANWVTWFPNQSPEKATWINSRDSELTHWLQEAYSRRNEFYISDSAGFFMSNVARFVDKDYLPTQEREDAITLTPYAKNPCF